MNCPICDSTNWQDHLRIKDFSISQEEFETQRCTACNLVVTKNAPSQKDIGPYYVSQDYISHSDVKHSLKDKLYHTVRERMLARKRYWIEEHNPSKGKLLDVGSGTGYFANHMKQNGWEVEGLEPSENARKLAKDKFDILLQDPQRLYKLENKYEAISMWHVLEHVHDLNQYIHRFHEILSDHGVLAIAVPNYTSIDAKKYGKYWAAYDVPRHLWHFSPESMSYLLEKHGFKLINRYGMPFDAHYVSLLSENYKKNSMGLFRAFLSGLNTNMKSRGKVENASSIVYIAKKN